MKPDGIADLIELAVVDLHHISFTRLLSLCISSVRPAGEALQFNVYNVNEVKVKREAIRLLWRSPVSLFFFTIEWYLPTLRVQRAVDC